MEFNEVIKRRCATRKFSNRKVPRDKLANILEAGRIAPTAKNLQPIKIYVIENNLDVLDKVTPCRYGAQTVLVVCGNKEESYQKSDHIMCEIDASIVATHMMLAATNEGIDNIWVEMFDDNKLKELFNITQELNTVCLIPIGYRDSNCPESSNHNKRKPIEDIAEYR